MGIRLQGLHDGPVCFNEYGSAGLELTPDRLPDMNRIEFGECCHQFSLLKASTETHYTGFFHFGGGFSISYQEVKINIYVSCHQLGRYNEKRTHRDALRKIF